MGVEEEFKKLIHDKEIEEKRKKWVEHNGGKGMPTFNYRLCTSYKKYKKVFLKEYEKLGID